TICLIQQASTKPVLLQFQSPDGRYPVASLGTSPRVGGEVFAAGFPFVDDLSQVPVVRDQQGGFVLQVGQVSGR
ncbi:MAG: hypothetical protein RLP02_01660, partial [Coleofasciculus sp. C2-GNP5-27]